VEKKLCSYSEPAQTSPLPSIPSLTAKRSVQINIEHYVRAFGNYQQSDWSTLLPIAKFA